MLLVLALKQYLPRDRNRRGGALKYPLHLLG